MRNLLCYFAAFSWALNATTSAGANRPAASPEPLVQWHFAGFNHVATSTNAGTLQAIAKLPTTVALRDHALDKVAAALARHLTLRSNNSESDASALIRTLLIDLWDSESYFELTKPNEKTTEWIFAIRPSKERLPLWEKNCSQLQSGWNLKTAAGTSRLSFSTSSSWFLLGSTTGNDGAFITKSAVFQKTQQQGRPAPEPADQWLKASLNGLSGCCPELKALDLSHAEVQVSPRKDGLRTELNLHYSKPQVWQTDRWLIPTNTIRDPLISFTAIRGLAPWLKQRPLIRELELQPTPNQLFIWSLGSKIPLQIHAAVPVRSAKEVAERLKTKTIPRWNSFLEQHGVGVIRPVADQDRITWQGLPLMIPSIRSVTEPKSDFLVADIFPVDPNPFKDPPPAGLIEQVTSRTNLVYYDWEITEARLLQVRPMLNLLSLVINRPGENTNSLTFKWLDSIQPKLGETITEGSVISPRQVNVVRRSHIGLNSLELLAMADWIGSTNFPSASFHLSFRAPSRQKSRSAP